MEDEFDVESLTGNTVDYTFNEYSGKAMIAAIAEGVGWTLVDPNDHKKELCCWVGPLSPNKKGRNTNAFTNAWPAVVGMLREGYYDSEKAFEAGGYGFGRGGAGVMVCAFS